ncbi:MAG TPA: hypothetical protein VIT44_00885 [Cyclobacteriaceae bacterium]
MKRLKFVGIALVTLLLFVCTIAHAQYQTAIGLRVGGTSGITVKHQFKDKFYGEAILGAFINGFSITGLAEKMAPVVNAEGLYFYYGGGAHVAVYNNREIYYSRFGREVKYHDNNDVALGIDVIGGLEYKFPNDIPIAISMDVKPFIEIGSGGYVGAAFDPAIGLKFTLR